MHEPTAPEARQQELRTYLSALWPDGVAAGSYLVASGGPVRALRCSSVEQFIAEFPVWEDSFAGRTGFTGGWIGVSQVDARVDTRTEYARGALDEITLLPALWLDIDLEAPTKPKGCPRPALYGALARLESVGLMPGLMVESGPSGMHLYWLLDEPLDLRGEDRARNLARHAEVHAYLYRVVHGALCEAAHRTVSLDRLIDPTRVLRPAGGTNLKPAYGAHRVTIAANTGQRHSISEIEEQLVVLDMHPPDASGIWRTGAYSAHPLLPKMQEQRRIYSNAELPGEVPPYLRIVSTGLPQLGMHTLERDGKPWLLKLGVGCPLCVSPSSPQRPGDSYVSVISGVYRCHHGSCRAHDGLSFSRWIRYAEFGADLQLQLAALRSRSGARRVHRRLLPKSAPKTSRKEVGLEIIKSLAESHLGKIGVVAIPTGAGKTRALAMISTKLSDIALLFRDYARVEEFINARNEYIAQEGITDAPELVLRKGVMRACAYKERIEKIRAERNVRSEVCWECDLKAICEAHSTAKSGQVLVSVHASHASLRNEGALQGRVVVFDEVPTEFSTESWNMQDVSHSLRYASKAKRAQDSTAIARVSSMLLDVMVALGTKWRTAGAPEHGLYVSPDELRAVMLGGHLDRQLMVEALLQLEGARDRRTATGAPDPMFHPLNLATLKSAKRGYEVPHRRGIEALWDALLPAISQPTNEGDTEALADMVWARGELSAMVVDGDAQLEVRRRHSLTVVGEAPPLDRGVVILSATGTLHENQIRAMNRACDVQVLGIQTGGLAPHMRVHAISSTVSRTALLAKGELKRGKGSRPEAWKRLFGALRAALTAVEAKHGSDVASALRERVGVLTYLGVRKGLDEADGWKLAQEAAGVRVLVQGHYGLDDQGSNEYLRQDVRLLVTLGDPTWNPRAIQADARFLGMDAALLTRVQETERLAQSEGRLRAGWDRPDGLTLTVHVHVGRVAPEHWEEGDFVSVLPTDKESALELPQRPFSAADPELHALLANSRVGSNRDPLRETPPVNSDRLVREAAERVLGAAGWARHPVRSVLARGRAVTWAPPDWSLEQVQSWADERLAELRAEEPRISEFG